MRKREKRYTRLRNIKSFVWNFRVFFEEFRGIRAEMGILLHSGHILIPELLHISNWHGCCSVW